MEHALDSDIVVASVRRRPLRRACGALLCAFATLLVWGLVAIALLSASGRFRIVAVSVRGADVHVAANAAAIVEPVPTLSLKEGDIFLAKPGKREPLTYYKVTAIDSWNRELTVRGPDGRLEHMRLGAQAWRLIAAVPLIGRFFHSLAGPVQAAAFLIVGLLLVARAELLRHPRRRPPEVTPSTV